MTPHRTTTSLPADPDTFTTPTAGLPTGATDGPTPGEGVSTMARRRPRATTRKRAWDTLSETDRQVLLESVRLRREAQAVHDVQELQAWAARMHR